MNKRLFSLCLALGAIALSAMAESYGIFVGGVEVTSKNCSNVTGGDIKAYSSSVNGGKPQVTFVKGDDSTPSVLTLWNVKIDRSGDNNRAINNKSCDVDIVFKGENYLRTTNATAIRIGESTVIRGEAYNGVMKTTVISTKENAVRVVSGKLLIIRNANLELSAQNDDCFDSEDSPELHIENSTVTATSTSTRSGDNYALKNYKQLHVENSTVTLAGYSQAVSGLQILTLGRGQTDVLTPGTGDGFGNYEDYSGSDVQFFAYSRTSSGFTAIKNPKTVKLQMSMSKDYFSWDLFNKIDKNNDTYVSVVERMFVTELAGVSLKGIEYLENLESLNCSNLHISSLDVSKNTKLKTLKCNSNELTSLDLSANTKLETLSCNFNRLTSLDLSKNTRLISLDCKANRDANDEYTLKTLNVSNCTLLTHLDCSFNLLLTSLNLSNNTRLTTLNCNFNSLTSLDLSKNTALTTLNCSQNGLTSLDLSKNTKLESLVCFSCRADGSYTLKTLNVSNCTLLTLLDCNSNILSSLDVTKNTALTELDCSSNRLTSLNVSKNTKLTTLYCYGNKIKGSNMTTLVNGLPKETSGFLRVVYKGMENYDNIITAAQVKTATNRGWKVQKYDGNSWLSYAGLVGDTNYDGKIDKTDLGNIVKTAMGKKPSSVDMNECDVNMDNKVNAADVVLLVDILNQKK